MLISAASVSLSKGFIYNSIENMNIYCSCTILIIVLDKQKKYIYLQLTVLNKCKLLFVSEMRVHAL